MLVYRELVREFFASFEFKEYHSRTNPTFKGVSFRLGGKTRTMSLLEFGWIIGLYDEEVASHDDTFRTLRSAVTGCLQHSILPSSLPVKGGEKSEALSVEPGAQQVNIARSLGAPGEEEYTSRGSLEGTPRPLDGAVGRALGAHGELDDSTGPAGELDGSLEGTPRPLDGAVGRALGAHGELDDSTGPAGKLDNHGSTSFFRPLFSSLYSFTDKAILSGADNRPPMLEKDMYDSSKSRMELYMLNRQHGRMILKSVKQAPLLWPTVEEDGVTRLKKYSKLSTAEAIQADCDVKATNIILQGLHLEVYALVSTHKQQASTYQTSPYATSYHTPQFVSQGPLSSTHSIYYPVTDTSSIVNHNAYMASSSAPQIDYAPMVQHSSKYSPPETGLVVLVFQKGDDHIDAINHTMSFLTAVVTLKYPATNNQLRTSSNPRSGGESGKHQVIVCYNCKGEGHMSKQCTKPKRKRDVEWFKDKVLEVQAQANGHVLQEEELEFLVDPGTTESSSN
nr:hypothetical protein [Tanacetum cinerariifolium]